MFHVNSQDIPHGDQYSMYNMMSFTPVSHELWVDFWLIEIEFQKTRLQVLIFSIQIVFFINKNWMDIDLILE